MNNRVQPSREAPVGQSGPVVYRVFNTPRDRFRFMALRNTGIGLVLATVVGAIQLSTMADASVMSIVFRSPITAGLFIPPLLFGLWLAIGATQERKAWESMRIIVNGDRLSLQRLGAPLAMQDAKHLVYQLAAIEGFALKPNGTRCSLALTQSGVLTVIPLERVGLEGEGLVDGQDWMAHPLIQALEAQVGQPPQVIEP